MTLKKQTNKKVKTEASHLGFSFIVPPKVHTIAEKMRNVFAVPGAYRINREIEIAVVCMDKPTV